MRPHGVIGMIVGKIMDLMNRRAGRPGVLSLPVQGSRKEKKEQSGDKLTAMDGHFLSLQDRQKV